MSPSYIRLEGPPRASTALAGKYALYLYREHGYDRDWPAHALAAPRLAMPVLFAPGNAGSYKQVRSLAAAAARQYAEKSSGVPLDFFAVDFNEDFSAFHAATLLDQAEYLRASVDYILSLYARYDVGSVVVVGHSMGGIAARQIRLTPGYRPGSVAHILTLATPHALPAVTFDARMDTLYDRLNAHDPGPDTTLVSVCGGATDTTIASDACAALGGLAGLADPERAFSVFTTSIPSLHAPVDHQAMMWCDQLRQALAAALLRIVDGRGRLIAPAKRIERFREALLSGLSDERSPTPVDLAAFASFDQIPVDAGERIVWRSIKGARRVKLPVRFGRTLRVLTDGDVTVAACAKADHCAVLPGARIPDRSANDPGRFAYELAPDITHTHAAEDVVIEAGKRAELAPTFLIAEWIEPRAIRPNLTLTGPSGLSVSH